MVDFKKVGAKKPDDKSGDATTDASVAGIATANVLKGAGIAETPAPMNSTTTATVDAATGEMKGDGFESQEAPRVDVVHMPKKIVAKEIVPRSMLKGTRKKMPKLDAKGNQMTDEAGDPAFFWELGEPQMLYVVLGTAAGTHTGESGFGDWVAFDGHFEATRYDGQRYQSTVLMLQEPAQTLLLDALVDLKRRDPAGSIGFSFEIGIKTSQKWADTDQGTSYAYTVKSIINTAKHDPLAHLRQAVQAHLPRQVQKALPSPTGSSET